MARLVFHFLDLPDDLQDCVVQKLVDSSSVRQVLRYREVSKGFYEHIHHCVAELDGHRMGGNIRSQARIASQFPALRSVVVTGGSLDNADLDLLTKSLPNLHTLGVDGLCALDDAGFEYLQRLTGLENLDLGNLQRVSFAHDSRFICYVSGNSTLTGLVLDTHNPDAHRVFKHCAPRLRTLMVSQELLVPMQTEIGYEKFAQLTTLRIQQCLSSYYSWRDSKYTRHLTQLQNLEVFETPLNMSAEGEWLVKFPRLHTAQCRLGTECSTEDAFQVLDQLRLQQVRTADMSSFVWNVFFQHGFQYLRRLYCSSADLSDWETTAQHLVGRCPVLEHVELDDSHLPDLFEHYMAQLAQLQTLLMTHCTERAATSIAKLASCRRLQSLKLSPVDCAAIESVEVIAQLLGESLQQLTLQFQSQIPYERHVEMLRDRLPQLRVSVLDETKLCAEDALRRQWSCDSMYSFTTYLEDDSYDPEDFS
eukprot:TRINITY_DN13148_c0_g1_i1.p1 TRINITY_DN13148_c0_g1~~TRINITY_DN13148_c0_g1_i1.p1  ORF type:complete len:487 (-),score=110.17 TRINITY_DN13148_c0_g1_i1:99-1529(-)